MRSPKIIFAGLIILTVLTASEINAQRQRHFTQIVTAQNISCNTACSVLDIPELNNNPAAIIFATPIGNTAALNPHPIGAYYMYLKKWSIYNLDRVSIPAGAQYEVEYYTSSGTSAFVFIVPRQVAATDIPYIDNDGLYDNPKVRIRLFPTSSPTHGALYNLDDVTAKYDKAARKWFIANINNKPVPWESVYNIVFTK